LADAGAGVQFQGEEGVDAVDRVVCDVGEEVSEIGFGIETVELGGFSQGVVHGGAPSALIRRVGAPSAVDQVWLRIP
jgi:hypothetical protein